MSKLCLLGWIFFFFLFMSAQATGGIIKPIGRPSKQCVWCLTHILELPLHSRRGSSENISRAQTDIFCCCGCSNIQKFTMRGHSASARRRLLASLLFFSFSPSLSSPLCSLLLPHRSVSIWQKPNNYLFLPAALTHCNVMTQTIHSRAGTDGHTGGEVKALAPNTYFFSTLQLFKM